MEDKASRWSQMKDSIKEREIKKTIVSHWHENKKLYIGIAMGLGTTVAYHIVKRSDGHVVDIDGSHNTVEIIGTQNNYAPKRLSYIVTDGDRWWESQISAAKTIGECPADVSKHLNHGQPLRSGVKLERVGVRS